MRILNHRYLITIIAVIMFQYPTLAFLVHGLGHNATLLDACKWDCIHYVKLTNELKPSAFFPLLPWLAQSLQRISGLESVPSLLWITNLFNIGASFLALLLGEALWEESTFPSILGFKRESWILIACLSLYPQHFFGMIGYPEPLFLFLFAGGWLALWKNRLLLSALSFSLTALARAQGIWVVAILGLFALYHLLSSKEARLKWFAFGLILALPFLGLLIWNHQITGDFLYFLKEQSKWGRSFDFLSGLKNHLPRYDDSRFFVYCTLGLGIAAFRKKSDPRWLVMIATMIAFAELPIFYGGYYSYVRFVSINLGLFCLASEFLASRPILTFLWLAFSLTRLAIATMTYTSGVWAG